MRKIAKLNATHNSDELLDKGSKLVAFIEAELEKTYSERFKLIDMFKNRKSSQTFRSLHSIFQLHKEYAFQNIERQKRLITNVKTSERTLMIAEINVIESQKQTIERLMASYANAIFAKQSEIASRRANVLSLFGILVAVGAIVITNLRLHTLLK